MNDKPCAVCPGCKRHCCACNPRCGYGKKYFSACSKKQKQHKWERYIERSGLIWQLFSVCKEIKKTLKKQKMSETEILSMLNEQDRQCLCDLLSNLKKQLDYSQ